MPRVIAQNRIPRVNIAGRSIAVQPLASAIAGLATGVGDITFAPVGFKFPQVLVAPDKLTPTASSVVVNVNQTAHGYSVGQVIYIANATGLYTTAGINVNGPQVIASIVDANNYTFNNAAPAGGAAGASFGGNFLTVQPLAPLSTPTAVGAVYEDALAAPSAWKKTSDYPALYAVQGVPTGRVNFISNAMSVASAISGFNWRQSQVWKGQIYSAASTCAIRKRASSMAAMAGADLFGPVASNSHSGMMATANYLVQLLWQSPNTSLRTVSGADVMSATVGVGNIWDGAVTMGHTAFETGTGTMIVLVTNPGPILRTTNGGAAWTAITSALSTTAARIWTCIWKSGANLYMVSQQGNLATSTDDGVTWTLNIGIPGAPSAFQCYNDANRQGVSLIALDLVLRRGFGITNIGQMLTWDLDNPTAGFTVDLASPWWTTPTGMRFVNTTYGLMAYLQNTATPTGTRVGIWARKRGAALGTFFSQVCIPSQLPVDTNVNGAPYTMACTFMEMGDGLIAFDNDADTQPTTQPMSFQIADLVNTFERYVLPVDPYLPSGRRPFIRVS